MKELTRREALKISGAAGGTLLLTSLPLARVLAQSSSKKVAVRSLAAGSGQSFEPFIGAFVGLAGFEEGLSSKGLDPHALAWSGEAASQGEITFLLLGFQPSSGSFENDVVTIRGSANDGIGYLAAASRTAFYPYPLYDPPVEETRYTPDGVAYKEVEVYQTSPSRVIRFDLVDASSGQTLSSTNVSLPGL